MKQAEKADAISINFKQYLYIYIIQKKGQTYNNPISLIKQTKKQQFYKQATTCCTISLGMRVYPVNFIMTFDQVHINKSN